jgi:hypothetical protein
LKPRYES